MMKGLKNLPLSNQIPKLKACWKTRAQHSLYSWQNQLNQPSFPVMKRHLTLFLIFLSALPAMAHPGLFHAADGIGATQAGFVHPFTGFDHLVVMVAVGLWAVQLGGRSLWILPCTFVGSMILGGLGGILGIHLTVVESGIQASIVMLGIALGMAWRPSLPIAATFVGLAGLCHGYAHGSEMKADLIPVLFFTGMVAATSLLHGLGLGGGFLLQRCGFMVMTRVLGFLVLAFAVYDFLCPVA
jgi:urease accessory protein